MTSALVILGAIALALLIRRAVSCCGGRIRCSRRVEELVEERSRLAASLEHAQSQLKSEREATQSQLQKQEQWVREQTELFEARVLAATCEADGRQQPRTQPSATRRTSTAVVAPFKEQLAEFRQRVDHIYAADTHERGSLKAQIETAHLDEPGHVGAGAAARRMRSPSPRSPSATGARPSSAKILEDSGLRKGHEYELQASITGRNGESLRPDAVIRLPESRQLMVDSKVSNKAWTEYCAATDEVEKDARLREHLLSLRTHMKRSFRQGLHRFPELSTVDFVLMFVPVEAALLTAFVKDPDLYADAYRAASCWSRPAR